MMKKAIKARMIVKAILPKSFRRWMSKSGGGENLAYFEHRSVSETFSEIYRNNVWGGEAGAFYSGDGSEIKFTKFYVDAVNEILRQLKPNKVVDIGCGDFRVASLFVNPSFKYIGLDVVPELIDHHNAKFANATTEFRVLDATSQELPDGDICLIRQVLQHLSNSEIQKILEKCRKFGHLIITEHFPPESVELIPNLDMPHGANTRIRRNSAVCVDREPFSLENGKEIANVTSDDGSRIITFHFRQ